VKTKRSKFSEQRMDWIMNLDKISFQLKRKLNFAVFSTDEKLIAANVVACELKSNETLLQELSIYLLKNTRQMVHVFEGCFESSKFLLTTVALENIQSFE
jgi:hypothetical protein